MEKQIYNFSDTSTFAKILPLVGVASGIGLAIYQKKHCVGCFLGYSLTGLLIASIPLAIQAKKAAEPTKLLEDCGCGK